MVLVPEPSTLLLAVVGCALLAACRLRRNALARSRRLGCTDVFQLNQPS
ncbi:MAG: PEP-CTERM sorting domain-containing protein [Pirellulales bacterium]